MSGDARLATETDTGVLELRRASSSEGRRESLLLKTRAADSSPGFKNSAAS